VVGCCSVVGLPRGTNGSTKFVQNSSFSKITLARRSIFKEENLSFAGIILSLQGGLLWKVDFFNSNLRLGRQNLCSTCHPSYSLQYRSPYFSVRSHGKRGLIVCFLGTRSHNFGEGSPGDLVTFKRCFC
jgi:hypothetical protein